MKVRELIEKTVNNNGQNKDPLPGIENLNLDIYLGYTSETGTETKRVTLTDSLPLVNGCDQTLDLLIAFGYKDCAISACWFRDEPYYQIYDFRQWGLLLRKYALEVTNGNRTFKEEDLLDLWFDSVGSFLGWVEEEFDNIEEFGLLNPKEHGIWWEVRKDFLRLMSTENGQVEPWMVEEVTVLLQNSLYRSLI